MVAEPMSTSSALFGVDGTQLPEPLPVLADPLIGPLRSPWLDTPVLPPPVPLPAAPDPRALREAMAALFGAEAIAEDQPGAPTSSADPTSSTDPMWSADPTSSAEPASARTKQFARPDGPPPAAGIPGPPRSAGHPAGPAGHPARPGWVGPRRATPPRSVPPRVRPPVRLADVRPGVNYALPAQGPPPRWHAGVQVGCVLALVILGLIVFNLIAVILKSLPQLSP